jgi:hypothetical protein
MRLLWVDNGIRLKKFLAHRVACAKHSKMLGVHQQQVLVRMRGKRKPHTLLVGM